MARATRIGLFLPVLEGWGGDTWRPSWSALRELAQLAEQVGFDSLFVPDHLIFGASPYWGIPEGSVRGTWECWTVLTALAEATSRIRLGTWVVANSFREPTLLAKMASTLDEIADGRLILGLGAGSHPPEYRAFGYPYDHLAGRFDEALQIIAPLLRTGRVTFQGKYYRAQDCELRPRRLTPAGEAAPAPPIWVAAFQPRLMTLAARWADALVTAWYVDPAALGAPLAALDAACQAVGRDPASIGRAVGVFVAPAGPDASIQIRQTPISGSSEAIARQLVAFTAAGADELVCMLFPRDRRGVEAMAPVIEQVRRLEAMSS